MDTETLRNSPPASFFEKLNFGRVILLTSLALSFLLLYYVARGSAGEDE